MSVMTGERFPGTDVADSLVRYYCCVGIPVPTITVKPFWF